jgi:carboxyl-terminal processing protease
MTEPSTTGSPAPRGASPLAWIISLVLASLVGALLFLGGYLAAGGAGGASCAAPNDAFASFCETYRRLKTEYVDQLSDEQLAEGAIRGMFQYGVEDPYSGYMAPEEYQQALGDLSGRFSGIGAEMAVKNLEDPGNLEACNEFSETCVFVVVAPLAGTPADSAGLQAGDIVTAVDGESVIGSTIQDQITKIRGEAGTDVVLSVERDGQAFDLQITRAEITIQEVTTRLIDGHIGYIELNNFSDNASDQFSAGLADLLDQGADQIVFDLRDNPGGYIEAAQQIASQFVESGLIFSQESSGDELREWEATGDGVATDPSIPLVVLVNGGSASASEIVAAALQETGRATLIGEPTFGKNTVQVWSRLPNDGGVRITISRWFTPDHNSVAPNGVQPDIAAAPTAETPPEQDVALERALAYLAEQVGGEPSAARPTGLAPDAATIGADAARIGAEADATRAPAVGAPRVVGIVPPLAFC